MRRRAKDQYLNKSFVKNAREVLQRQQQQQQQRLQAVHEKMGKLKMKF